MLSEAVGYLQPVHGEFDDELGQQNEMAVVKILKSSIASNKRLIPIEHEASRMNIAIIISLHPKYFPSI